SSLPGFSRCCAGMGGSGCLRLPAWAAVFASCFPEEEASFVSCCCCILRCSSAVPSARDGLRGFLLVIEMLLSGGLCRQVASRVPPWRRQAMGTMLAGPDLSAQGKGQ